MQPDRGLGKNWEANLDVGRANGGERRSPFYTAPFDLTTFVSVCLVAGLPPGDFVYLHPGTWQKPFEREALQEH